MDMLTVMVTGAVAQPCLLDAARELRVMYKVVHDPCLLFSGFLPRDWRFGRWLFACLPLSRCLPACPTLAVYLPACPAYPHQQTCIYSQGVALCDLLVSCALLPQQLALTWTSERLIAPTSETIARQALAIVNMAI